MNRGFDLRGRETRGGKTAGTRGRVRGEAAPQLLQRIEHVPPRCRAEDREGKGTFELQVQPFPLDGLVDVETRGDETGEHERQEPSVRPASNPRQVANRDQERGIGEADASADIGDTARGDDDEDQGQDIQRSRRIPGGGRTRAKTKTSQSQR